MHLRLATVLLLAPPISVTAQTAAQPSGASAPAFEPNVRPTLQVTRTTSPIRIDGKLDDAGWVGAARATNFAEYFPHEKAKPSVDSEVWVTYDDTQLYLAFVARDDPRTIRASLRDRDRMWSDDYFGILLDTYGDASWAYYLFANPYGIQGDSRFSTTGSEDDTFDVIYHTQAQITEAGYQIEMAIPFASLRFPDRLAQTWRATFWRTHPRGSRSTYTWAAIDRNDPCFLCQFGTLSGIEGVKPGGALELMPSVVTSQASVLRDSSDPNSGLDNREVNAQLSLGARYSFASGITAEGSWNPDFSQVESDAGQIDVNTTFALFFPERRPFFQEGSDLFDTWIEAVYTRQINDPQAAAKLIGRMGRTTVAYLGARDEHSPLLLPFEERSFVGEAGKSISNIARVRRTFGRESYIGGLLTDRRYEDSNGSGTVVGVDGLFRFLGQYRLEYQLLSSHTREADDPTLTAPINDLSFDRGRHTAAFDGESYSGYGQYTSLERSARTWTFDFDYWASSPTFRTDNGFETRNDFRRGSMYQQLAFYPNSRWVDQIRPSIYLERSWNFQGQRKIDFVRPLISLNLKGQTYLELAYRRGRERFADVDFDNLWRAYVYADSRFSELVGVELFVARGREIARLRQPPIVGSSTDVELSATIKPFTRLLIEPSLVYARLKQLNGGQQIFDGYILRNRTSFQFTRELFLRVVVEYDNFDQFLSIEPLLTYKINPFTLFYVGSAHGYQDYDSPERFAQTTRQFFAKFQYLIRR